MIDEGDKRFPSSRLKSEFVNHTGITVACFAAVLDSLLNASANCTITARQKEKESALSANSLK
jgi:hypothetical protein